MDASVELIEAITAFFVAAGNVPSYVLTFIFGVLVMFLSYLSYTKWLNYKEGNQYQALVSECRASIDKLNEHMGKVEVLLNVLLKK